MLEFNKNQKFNKALFLIDLQCLIEKIDGCTNNPENSTTATSDEHIPSGFSLFTRS